MNWVDVIALVVILLGLSFGAKKGLIRAGATMVGLGTGVYLAFLYAPILAPTVQDVVPYPALAFWLGFGIIVVAILLAAEIGGSALTRMLRLIVSVWMDRLGGAVMGSIASTIAIGALAGLVARMAFEVPEQLIVGLQESRLVSSIVSLMPAILSIFSTA